VSRRSGRVASPCSIAYTRSGSRPSAASRSYTAAVASSIPMSCTPVSPAATACCAATRIRRSRTSAVGAGTLSITRSAALSISRPVGSPRASRRILPPTGSFVARVMPAAASAGVLTHAA